MDAQLYRDEAVVLRTHRLGEADRIIVSLTRSHGQVRAVARGVRRTTSRFGARLEPFSLVDVQLRAGRNLDVVAQVETIEPFGRDLARDYSVFTCASTMAETAERLTRDGADLGTSDSPQQFLLLYGALAALARRRVEPTDAPAGHIPGALSASLTGNLDDAARFLPPSVLAERYAALGVADAAGTTVYCGSGVSACHDLLAMERAGLGRGRLYVGSWSQYAFSGLPIATPTP